MTCRRQEVPNRCRATCPTHVYTHVDAIGATKGTVGRAGDRRLDARDFGDAARGLHEAPTLCCCTCTHGKHGTHTHARAHAQTRHARHGTHGTHTRHARTGRTHRTAPHLTSPHLTAPHRTAPHRTAPHRTAPHRTQVYDGYDALVTVESLVDGEQERQQIVRPPCGIISELVSRLYCVGRRRKRSA